MKNIYLFITTILLFSVSCLGQLDQNTWLVGGTGSFDSYKQESNFISQNTGQAMNSTYNFKNIQLSGSIGYFLKDKLVTGLKFTYSDIYGTSELNGEVGGRNYSLGPLVRYYFLNKEKQFNILAEVNYQYGVIDKGRLFSDNNGTTNSVTFLIGTEVFFNSTVGMDFLLGYNNFKQKMNNIYTPSVIQDGFLVSVGFQIHLEKK